MHFWELNSYWTHFLGRFFFIKYIFENNFVTERAFATISDWKHFWAQIFSLNGLFKLNLFTDCSSDLKVKFILNALLRKIFATERTFECEFFYWTNFWGWTFSLNALFEWFFHWMHFWVLKLNSYWTNANFFTERTFEAEFNKITLKMRFKAKNNQNHYF
jgi:hypothetical protein